jgi:hypothetical protein
MPEGEIYLGAGFNASFRREIFQIDIDTQI